MPKEKKCPKCGLNCYKNCLGLFMCPKCENIDENHKLDDFSKKKIEDYI